MKNTQRIRDFLFVFKIKFLICFLCCYPIYVFSNDNISHPKFRTINSTNGLTNNTINTIYKDKRGFVWIGTQTGICRFDGIAIKKYPALNSLAIHSIIETDSINLWIGTSNGLMKLDRKTDEIKEIDIETKDLKIKDLQILPDNQLLIASDKGLIILKNKEIDKILFNSNALSPSNEITQIIKGYDANQYWLTTCDGLVELDILSKKYTIYRNKVPSVNDFFCIVKSGSLLYLGTKGQGIVKFDINSHTFSQFPSIGNEYIMNFKIQGNDSLYVATNGGGVRIVSMSKETVINTIEHSNKHNSLISNAVYTFLIDNDNLWVGTYMGGVSYTPYKKNEFRVYSFLPQFNSRGLNIRSFWIGNDGHKLIGTRDGLYYISEKENILKLYTTNTSVLRSDIIVSIFPYRNNYVIGTYGGGIYLFETKTASLSYFGDDVFFQSGSFTGYTYDKNGNLWISSSKGLCNYDVSTGKSVIYNKINSGLLNNSVFAIMCDSKNRIWLEAGGCITMYNPLSQLFQTNVVPPDLTTYTKSIRCIYEDRNKNIWFCDNTQGVIKVNEQFTEFEHLTTENGLPDNSIAGIIEDDEGLWFSSQNGLMHRNIKSNENRYISIYDGIPGYIFNNALQKTKDGTIWWGNEQGLVYLNKKDKAIADQIQQPPAITSIYIAGKPLHTQTSEFTSNINISEAENNIEFTFSALTFSDDKTDIYEYILEGYDDNWKRVIGSNKVSYTNLPTGNYIFKIKNSSYPQLVSSVNLTIKRSVPVFVWVILTCIIVIVIIIFFYSKLLNKNELIKAKTSKADNKNEKYSKSKMEEVKVNQIKIDLFEYIEKEKPYLNPDLKLQDIAESIHSSPVDISQLLNQHLNTNFSDFVNEFRINEFIERVKLSSAQKYTLATLSEQCGFSSRTSFFRSFKKITGKTPAEYVKELGIKLQ